MFFLFRQCCIVPDHDIINSRKKIGQMLKVCVDKQNKNERPSPIVFLNEGYACAFCLDYCRLNVVTVQESNHVLKMREDMDFLAEARIFSALDANYGYWQIEMNEKLVDKIIFVTHHEDFQYMRMLFRLKYASGTFWKAINVVLVFFKLLWATVNIGDVIGFLKFLREQFNHVNLFFGPLKTFILKIKLKKYHFFHKSIDHLRHVAIPGTQQAAKPTTVAVESTPYPENFSQMRSFVKAV